MNNFEITKINDTLQIKDFATIKKQLEQELLTYAPAPINSFDDLKLAKSNRANLNNTQKAISQNRLAIEKQVFGTFKNECKELEDMIKNTSTTLDTAIKVYEAELTKEKEEHIRQYFNSSFATAFNTTFDTIKDDFYQCIDISLAKNTLEVCYDALFTYMTTSYQHDLVKPIVLTLTITTNKQLESIENLCKVLNIEVKQL